MNQEYEAYCAAHGRPERIELMLCDINAVLRGKWLPGDAIGKLEAGTVRLPYSTYAPAIMGNEVEATGLGIVVGDPDGVLVPVPGTLCPVPWMPGNVAQLQVEMLTPEGGASPISPRELLKNMLARFNERGWHPVVATELEFYILRPRERGDDAPIPPARTPMAQNYDLEVVSRQEAILTEILNACETQGLETDTLIAEYGPGQFEVNFHHTDDVLRAAETAIFFRRLVRGIVARHGMEATFMAKPYADAPGNGMHVHCSVLDDEGNNIFTPEPGQSGPSPVLKQAVAGVLDTMADLQVIFAPHMNSYRRFQRMSFAPSGPDWGLDNRSAGVRLPEIGGKGARLEHRIAGADVNPYLVLTAILGGILHGIDTDPELPPSLDEPGAEPADPLGHDWFDAVERFAESDHAAEIFGEEYRFIYTAVKNDEVQTLTSLITPVEYRYYLSRL